MTKKHEIYVTQPTLPSLDEFLPYLEKIWDSKVLTNGGQFHQELERALSEYLGVKYVSLFSNGTLALITALQALQIKGEVITTPYSFVATSHSLLWNGITPVFVDIDPITFNLDPDKIEGAITPLTTAILPVHCYGHPCDVRAIKAIADKYGLNVIYDAAHAFGVSYEGDSLLNSGDLSVLSFHATKVFNTFEGGAIICDDENMKRHIDYLKNFGIADEVTVVAPGINAKMNEFQAALGLAQLKHIDDAFNERKQIDQRYRHTLSGIPGLKLHELPERTIYNYSYFPILITSDFPLNREEVYDYFREEGIMVRRYFYPLISEQPTYKIFPSADRGNLSNAVVIADQILCLPIYPDLSEEDQCKIIDILVGLSKL